MKGRVNRDQTVVRDVLPSVEELMTTEKVDESLFLSNACLYILRRELNEFVWVPTHPTPFAFSSIQIWSIR